jgi:DNA-directed RNA polymerase specialized sigma subunit
MADKATELELWKTWKKHPSNDNLMPLMKAIEPIIVHHTNKMTGNLPRSAIRGEAVRLTVAALDKYDPSKAQLNTHLFSSLRKLNRYVYEHQNMGTIPEPRITKIGLFNNVKSNLEEQLGRVPTTEELADELKWSPKQIKLLQKELRSDLVHDFSYGNVMEDQRADIDEYLDMLREELIGTDRDVLDYSYGLNGKKQLSNQEIAGKLGISPSAVTQIKAKLADRLRSSGVMSGY